MVDAAPGALASPDQPCLNGKMLRPVPEGVAQLLGRADLAAAALDQSPFMAQGPPLAASSPDDSPMSGAAPAGQPYMGLPSISFAHEQRTLKAEVRRRAAHGRRPPRRGRLTCAPACPGARMPPLLPRPMRRPPLAHAARLHPHAFAWRPHDTPMAPSWAPMQPRQTRMRPYGAPAKHCPPP